MILQEMLDQKCKEARENRVKETKQMTLGEFLKKLSAIKDKSKEVRFSFAYYRPTSFHSYRGIYSEIALGYTDESNIITVQELISIVKKSIGVKFPGYKGGDFRMTENTPVWIDNQSMASSTALVDVVEDRYGVYLETKHIEPYVI